MIVLGTTPAAPSAPLSSSLTVKMTDAEKAKVRRDSADAGMSMSAWSRKRLTT